MSRFTIKSTFADKWREAARLLRTGGFHALFKKTVRYAQYLLGEQSHFIYFTFLLDQPLPNFHPQTAVNIRRAGPEDSAKIHSELFPSIAAEEENDKRYFALLGKPGANCFLAEKDGILLHYTWFFWDALHSPLVDTPFRKALLREGDAYVGPAFTSPCARGTWIYPSVLLHVLSYAKETAKRKRIILFVNGKNAAAVHFFIRLGFQRI